MTGQGNGTTFLHLAQRALHTREDGFESGVEGIFFGLCPGNVSLTGGGDLDAIAFIGTARVTLMLELYMEEC